MSRKRKRNFNLGKNKLVNFLRSGLRILFLIIFFHWILWFTTYAKCTNYREAINDEKIDKHDKKTEKYNSKGLLGDKFEEKNIGEIENDILNQIERKKPELKGGDLPRKWEKEKLPDLKKLHEKTEEYDKKFKKYKEETIDNIQKQLQKNDLNITELDDNRSWEQKMTHDPLKFFLVSPLNQASKTLGLHNHLFLEIIFKLVIIEIILLVISYSETIKVWENMEKMRDPYLSVEEKEQLNEEASPLVKYIFFNGFMMALFNFFLSFHPAFFDKTDHLFQAGATGTAWYIWVFPIFFSFLLSNIGTEFLRQGRLLNKQEWKNCLVKSWAFSLFLALLMLTAMRIFGVNSIGIYLLSSLGGLVRFIISAIRVKFFGHREYSPHRGTTTTHPTEQHN